MSTYSHYRGNSVHRELDAFERMKKLMRPEDNGYDTKCFIYTGSLDRDGFGRIKVKGNYIAAHHVMMPDKPHDKAIARHRCGQPACVRPTHLFWE